MRRVGFVALAAGVLLAAGCASLYSTARMGFYPLGGERSQTPFSTDLKRSCELDDCRIQRVELRWPDGELMTGELRFLAVGVTPPEPRVGPVPASGAILDDVPRRRPGVMALSGDRGSKLGCELTFHAGTRNAVGICKHSSGAAYTVDL